MHFNKENAQVLDIVRQHSLNTEVEVYAFAAVEERQGRRALAAFLAECDNLEGLLRKAHLLTTAVSSLAVSKLSRVEHLANVIRSVRCTCEELGLWHSMATEILNSNHLNGTFQSVMYRILQEGRRKMNNLFIVGPPNCAKSFLLNPLKVLFDTYLQPDGGSYQMEALMGKQVAYLNDFEWDHSEKWCRWSFFKNFLEGGSLAVARPKNRGGNTVFELDSPVFGTCASPVQLLSKGSRSLTVNQMETNQMDKRILYVRLFAQIGDGETRDCKPCATCAARLYLQGKPGSREVARRSRSPRRG